MINMSLLFTFVIKIISQESVIIFIMPVFVSEKISGQRYTAKHQGPVV